MRNRTIQLIFTFSLFIILLTGCSTHKSVPLTAENRTSIKKVHIDVKVSKPDKIFWYGTEESWGGVLFGALGAAATSSAGKTDAELMVKFMDEKHIDISEIVYSEVFRQVGELNVFDISNANKIDATLIVSVDLYGFTKTHPFGSNMNPIILITGKLSKPNNKIIWQETEYVSDYVSENDQGQSLETYKNEPEKLRAALAKASKVAVNRLLEKLL